MSPHLLSGAARMAGSSLLRLQADERLVALVRDGHDPAFSALVDRYRPELLRYAARLVGGGRAEDVLQQAFLNAYSALVSSENDIRLRPWLYRIAHNTALNALRSGRAQEPLDDRLAASGEGVEHDVETRERLRDALAAIARLPEPQRDALTLQALEGRSHEEIAGAIGVTPGAARQHLHRARASVRAAVSAVTPYGLMARFATAGDDPATGALLGSAGAGAGAGIAATATKVGAGVLAAGAIATGGIGHVPFVAEQPVPRAEAQRHAPVRSAVAGRAAPAAEVAAVAAPPASRSHSRSHPEDDSGGHRSRHGSSGGDDRREDSSGHRGGSGSSGSGDDDRREDSSGHGSSSGSDDSSGHGSVSGGGGDDGSSGSGSDDGHHGGSDDDGGGSEDD